MEELFLSKVVTKAVLSSPLQSSPKKISLRAILLKDELVYQLSVQKERQQFHTNYSPKEIYPIFKKWTAQFKQLHLYTQDQLYHYLWNRNREETLIKKKLNQPLSFHTHNKQKKYLILDNEPIPFLIELGIQSAQGVIKSDKRDKFIQINKFLEILLPHLTECKTVVDFGCGKAYLTFALAHFFKGPITGIDLKETLLDDLNQIAKKLTYTHLSFKKGDIKNYKAEEPIDAVIALHACNIATDEAIYQGIRRGAKVIIVAPCCHQELYNQIESEALKPILKHGILKERLASLATDAARAELLSMHGYKTDVIEFIDHGHTPKNILIRAVKNANAHKSSDYAHFCQALNIKPHLHNCLSNLKT